MVSPSTSHRKAKQKARLNFPSFPNETLIDFSSLWIIALEQVLLATGSHI